MSAYSNFAWLPLCGGLAIVGFIVSWLAWRRRGAAAGMRLAAWSLLPLAAYLTGVIKLAWGFGVALTSFATSFVFSAQAWSGIIVAVVATLLFVISGAMRSRRAVKQAGPDAKAAGQATGAPAKAVARKAKPAADDDLGDIAEILKRRNIR